MAIIASVTAFPASSTPARQRLAHTCEAAAPPLSPLRAALIVLGLALVAATFAGAFRAEAQ